MQEDPDFWQTSDNPEPKSSPSNKNGCTTTVEEPLCDSDTSFENKGAECKKVNGKQVARGKEACVNEDERTELEDNVDKNKDEEVLDEEEKEEGPRCWAEVEERLGESQAGIYIWKKKNQLESKGKKVKQ